MPIPSLTAEGSLPIGVHDCTLVEIGMRFAPPGSSQQRIVIYDALIRHLRGRVVQDYTDHALVDGSFVTAKAVPGDADIVLGLKPGSFRRIDGLAPLVDPAVVIADLKGCWAGSIDDKPILHVFPREIQTGPYQKIADYFQHSDRANEPPLKGILRVAIP
jgi:hypothetical protein